MTKNDDRRAKEVELVVKIAVLADTHIPKRAKTLPDSAWRILKSADVILHAGDVLTKEFLDQLSQIAPLYAVRGNNDTDSDQLARNTGVRTRRHQFGDDPRQRAEEAERRKTAKTFFRTPMLWYSVIRIFQFKPVRK